MEPFHLPKLQPSHGIALPGPIVTAEDDEDSLVEVEADEFMEEYLWHLSQYINEHVRFSDTKAGSVVVLAGAVLSLLYSGGFYHAFADAPITQWGLRSVASLLTFLCLGGSVLLSAWSMRPRLIRNYSTGFIFWESILAHGSSREYTRQLHRQTRQQLLDHLAEQIYNVSAVASTKFRWVGRSITLCMAGALIGALVLVLH
jgi:hypothetical protein